MCRLRLVILAIKSSGSSSLEWRCRMRTSPLVWVTVSVFQQSQLTCAPAQTIDQGNLLRAPRAGLKS